MSWDARSLETVVLSNGDTVYYTYNSSGIRTQKRIVSSTGAVTTHDYLLDGTNILKETVSGAENYVLEYLYDESGVAGIKYNGSALYFIKNLQGDVIALTDDSAIKLVQYTYDAWGNVISITGGLASLLGNINPIRYRGYYYDTDTGYYYLNSRYYDPAVGRFLNGDAFLGINGGILGYNMYAYCNNSPVAFADSTGTVMMPNILPDEPEPPKLPAKPSRPKPSIEKSEEIVADKNEHQKFIPTNDGTILNAFVSAIEINAGYGRGLGASVEGCGFAAFCDESIVIDDNMLFEGQASYCQVSLNGLQFEGVHTHLNEMNGSRPRCRRCDTYAEVSRCRYSDFSWSLGFGPISINNEGELLVGTSFGIHIFLGFQASVALNVSELIENIFE